MGKRWCSSSPDVSRLLLAADKSHRQTKILQVFFPCSRRAGTLASFPRCWVSLKWCVLVSAGIECIFLPVAAVFGI